MMGQFEGYYNIAEKDLVKIISIMRGYDYVALEIVEEYHTTIYCVIA